MRTPLRPVWAVLAGAPLLIAAGGWLSTGGGLATAIATHLDPPAAVTAAADGGGARIAWTAASTGAPASAYAVTRTQTIPSGGSTAVCGGVASSPCLDAPLTEGRFSYAVAAKQGGWSSIAVPATGEVNVPPNAPSSVSTTLGSSTTVSWVDTSMVETSFLVERQLGAGSWGTVGSVPALGAPASGGTVSTTDTGSLPCGTTIRHRVTATGPTGTSAVVEGTPVSTPSCLVVRVIAVSGAFGPSSGSTTITFTVTVVDAANNPVSGTGVAGSLSQWRNSQQASTTSTTAVSCTTGSSGTCDVSVTTSQGNIDRATFTLGTVTPPAGGTVGTHTATTASASR